MCSASTATYAAAAPRVYGAPIALPPRAPPRAGYASATCPGDLRNHVMGKMMWEAVRRHDRDRFELYFYSLSAVSDEWTERYRGLGRPLRRRSPMPPSAKRPSASPSTSSTCWSILRPIRAAPSPASWPCKPARVQITHVASAGVVGLSHDRLQADRRLRRPAGEPGRSARDAAADGRLRLSVPPYRPGRRASVPSRPTGDRRRRGGHRRVRQSDEAVAALPCALARGARAHSARRARDIAAVARRGRSAAAPVRRRRHRAATRRSCLPAGRDEAENQARYRRRRLRARSDALRRRQRHAGGARHGRARRDAVRAAARRAQLVQHPRQPRRRRHGRASGSEYVGDRRAARRRSRLRARK